jgi:predicted PurR-regulated permease PerM
MLASNSEDGQNIYIISGVVTFTTGIFLTIIRLFEPLFKLLVYKQIWQFFGELYEPKEGEQTEAEFQIASDSLSTFLTSSLNVELVYIILTGVTVFADQDDRRNEDN